MKVGFILYEEWSPRKGYRSRIMPVRQAEPQKVIDNTFAFANYCRRKKFIDGITRKMR